MADLNYMMYTSMNGDERQANLKDYFKLYHDKFVSVLKANKQDINFTLARLKKEFHDKNMIGFIQATSSIPMTLMESEEVAAVADLKEKDDAQASTRSVKIRKFVESNSLPTTRLLNMFDEMKEEGLFNYEIK